MSRIKEIIDALPLKKQKELQEAFDNQEPYFVEYEMKNYIGVNVASFWQCIENERIGEYSLGRIREKPEFDTS